MSTPAVTGRTLRSLERVREADAAGPVARALALPAALVGLWALAAHEGRFEPAFLPGPDSVVARGIREIGTGGLLDQLWASLRRDLVGFGLGSAAGVTLGLAIGFSRLLRKLLAPLLLVHRQIALFAWVPLISLWFGGGETGKIVFVALASFQPSLVNSWRGAAAIPRQYRELAATWDYGSLAYVRFIALPAALPGIFSGLHAASIYGWSATIGAELLFDIGPGLGGRMNEGQQLFQMDLLLLCLLTLGSIGLAINLLTAALERRLLRWRAP